MKRTKPKPADIAHFDAVSIRDIEFFIATARLALKQRIKRDNQPKASPEAGRCPSKPGGS